MENKRIPIDDLKVGMYVEKVESSNNQCPIKQAGYIRTEAVLTALRQYKVRHVVVNLSKSLQDNEQNIPLPDAPYPAQKPTQKSAETIKPLADDNLALRIEKVILLTEKTKKKLKEIGSRIEHIKTEDWLALENVATELNQILADDPVACRLIIKLHDGQNDIYDHSVNVAILIGLFVQHMGFESSINHELILAGLLHDVGLITVPNKILGDPKQLGEKELCILHGHVDLGKEILNTQYKNISDICLSAISHHHERLDGSGYPCQLTTDSISFWGKILAIVDSYESMTAVRSYAQQKTNNQAMACLLKDNGHKYDASIAALFAQFIGAYPIGSCVLCKQQETEYLALVINENKNKPLQPIVVVFFNPTTRQSITPNIIDLHEASNNLTIIRSVNPSNYGIEANIKELLTKFS